MIVLPRAVARSFRALRGSACPAGPADRPRMWCLRASAGTLQVWTRTADAGLLLTSPTSGPDATLVVPMDVLEAIEGPGPDDVQLRADRQLNGAAAWTDRGTPRTHTFRVLLPGQQHAVPALPEGDGTVPVGFVQALHECGRNAARDPTRYALHRVQVRGKAGTVAGTDAHSALVWGGFALPFPDDVLIPAVPVFGAGELIAAPVLSVALTPAHLIFRSGPWTVFLPTDPKAKFPDVEGVVPRHAPTTARIDEDDAVLLLDRLRHFPKVDADRPRVTLDVDRGVTVRAKNEETGEVREVVLSRSTFAGPPAAIALETRYLVRALQLQCLTVRITPAKPVVFEGEHKTFLAVPLHPECVVPPPTPRTVTSRRPVMKPPETNGHAPRPREEPPDDPDPLAAAEELRAALAEAVQKAGRLVNMLKHTRKEKKALTQVWAGLKQLNLGGGSP